MPQEDDGTTWDDIYRLINPLANVVDIQSEYKDTQETKSKGAAKERKAEADAREQEAKAKAEAAERIAKAEAEAAKKLAEAEVVAAKAEAQNAKSYSERAAAEAKLADAQTTLAAAKAEAAKYAAGKWADVATASLVAVGLGAWLWNKRGKKGKKR